LDEYSSDDVRRIVKEENVKFIRLQFTDAFGKLKNVSITANQLDGALENTVMFDGSSIDGFVRVEESDMYLIPDPTTFEIFPWKSEGKSKTARLICDVKDVHGEPFDGCCRTILKDVLKELKEFGMDFHVGPEVEFFLFETDEKGNPTLETHDQAGYFDLAPDDLGEEARRDICLALEEMGFEIEASHHECAPGQHEIDFKYEEALKTADNVSTFKLVVKNIAKQHGLHASFMPKPVPGESGACMHLNQSLFKDGVNQFYDENGQGQLSDIAFYFMGGLLKYAREYAAITNPTVNSYKRLVPGYEAPTDIAWAMGNRSPLIRVPVARKNGTRIELRNPDPTANHYLVLATVLSAGLEGIKNKIEPPADYNGNIYSMDEKERERTQTPQFPENLMEAVQELENSDFMKRVLGDHIHNVYVTAKKAEWNDYRTTVHQWELDRYLTQY